MRLLDHLKASDESVAAFAMRVGKPHNTIRKIAYGQRQPSLELAALIERATGGVVTPSDMVIERVAA